jgi:hypothetical protein
MGYLSKAGFGYQASGIRIKTRVHYPGPDA